MSLEEAENHAKGFPDYHKKPEVAIVQVDEDVREEHEQERKHTHDEIQTQLQGISPQADSKIKSPEEIQIPHSIKCCYKYL